MPMTPPSTPMAPKRIAPVNVVPALSRLSARCPRNTNQQQMIATVADARDIGTEGLVHSAKAPNANAPAPARTRWIQKEPESDTMGVLFIFRVRVMPPNNDSRHEL